MAYDKVLADTLRELFEAEPGITEKKMFGGLAFLVEGNMAIAASGQGGALVRADPTQSEHLVAAGEAEVAVMRGRAMPGWLRVPSQALDSPEAVARWARVGLTYARTLPPK